MFGSELFFKYESTLHSLQKISARIHFHITISAENKGLNSMQIKCRHNSVINLEVFEASHTQHLNWFSREDLGDLGYQQMPI